MKKILFTLSMTSFLVACTTQTTEENIYIDPNLVTQVEVIPPSQVKTQPDEFLESLQTIKDLPVQEKTGSDMEWLSKKLRKELRASGIKVKEVDGQIDLIIPNSIAFGNTQKAFSPSFSSNLSSVASLLKEYDQTMIQIIGYTDDVSPVLVAKELSLKKADEIANFLREQGIEAGRIITDGAGADDPVATNATSAGREQNRRIEMTIISLQ